MSKLRKILDRPEGYGQIRTTKGKSVGVRYSLVVFQTLDADTGPTTSNIEMRGAIEVDNVEGLVDLAGQHFTLKTSDGRCVEASVNKGDPATRQWEIVSTGPDGLVPC